MFKRRKGVFGLGVLISLFLIDIVSALNLDNVTRGISDVFGTIFGFLLNTTSYDVYFFEKILFLIIVFLIIRFSLETFPPFKDKSKRGIVNIISIAISLIGVRYLTELDIVKGILIPYGTLTTAILTILPFIIFFFFIHQTIESKTGRKIAWIFYMIILFGIWWNRYDQLKDVENYIYLAIFALALGLFFFDNRVREYFEIAAAREAVRNVTADEIINATNELREAVKAAAAYDNRDPLLNRMVDKKKRKLEILRREHGSG